MLINFINCAIHFLTPSLCVYRMAVHEKPLFFPCGPHRGASLKSVLSGKWSFKAWKLVHESKVDKICRNVQKIASHLLFQFRKYRTLKWHNNKARQNGEINADGWYYWPWYIGFHFIIGLELAFFNPFSSKNFYFRLLYNLVEIYSSSLQVKFDFHDKMFSSSFIYYCP